MLNFKVQGYQRVEYRNKEKDSYEMFDVIEIFVWAKNSTEAIKKAEKLIKRKFYRVSRVDESLDHDPWKNFPFEKLSKLLKTK